MLSKGAISLVLACYRQLQVIRRAFLHPFHPHRPQQHLLQVAQYQAYWGDQLLPKPVYDEWWKKCVADGYRVDGNDEHCDVLEAEMDSLIGTYSIYKITCKIIFDIFLSLGIFLLYYSDCCTLIAVFCGRWCVVRPWSVS